MPELGQKFVCDVNSVNVMFTVLEVQVVDLEQLSGKKDEKKEAKTTRRVPKRGLLVQQSELEFAQAGTGTVKITGNPKYVAVHSTTSRCILTAHL